MTSDIFSTFSFSHLLLDGMTVFVPESPPAFPW